MSKVLGSFKSLYLTTLVLLISVITANSYVFALGAGSSNVSSAIGERAPAPSSLAQPESMTKTNFSPIDYYNWSGYAATTTKSFNKVIGSYIQPSINCSTAADDNSIASFWVGFDGFSNYSVEQAGTEAECGQTPSTPPTYVAWWEMYPTNNMQITKVTIKPGDHITDSVIYNTNGTYTLKVADTTDKQSASVIQSCGSGIVCQRESAEWIIERPTLNSSYSLLGNWGTVKFTASEAATDNYPSASPEQGISKLTYFPINMINYSGNALANVSPLSSTGASFSDNWVAEQ